MAQRSRTSRGSAAEDWLVEGLGKARTKAKRSTSFAERPKPAAPAGNGRGARLPGAGRITGRLRRGRAGDSQEGRAARLQEQVKKLKAELREEKKRGKQRVAAVREEVRAGAEKLPRGKLDANSATFEQLRALGLSVTQSANLIRRREQKGGFRSTAELKRIPGLSQAARKTIEERLRASRR